MRTDELLALAQAEMQIQPVPPMAGVAVSVIAERMSAAGIRPDQNSESINSAVPWFVALAGGALYAAAMLTGLDDLWDFPDSTPVSDALADVWCQVLQGPDEQYVDAAIVAVTGLEKCAPGNDRATAIELRRLAVAAISAAVDFEQGGDDAAQ